MGLDVGEKRIGIALSDPLGLVAQPLEVVKREKALERLKEIVLAYGVQEVVVGLPLRPDGSLSLQAQRIWEFARQLEASLGLPVRYWDESFTTHEAERLLLQADQSRKRRKRTKDKVAAALILQGYLEARKKDESR